MDFSSSYITVTTSSDVFAWFARWRKKMCNYPPVSKGWGFTQLIRNLVTCFWAIISIEDHSLKRRGKDICGSIFTDFWRNQSALHEHQFYINRQDFCETNLLMCISDGLNLLPHLQTAYTTSMMTATHILSRYEHIRAIHRHIQRSTPHSLTHIHFTTQIIDLTEPASKTL